MSFDSESKVWYGPNDPYLYGNMSIGEAIFEFMSENPDHMMEVRCLSMIVRKTCFNNKFLTDTR